MNGGKSSNADPDNFKADPNHKIQKNADLDHEILNDSDPDNQI